MTPTRRGRGVDVIVSAVGLTIGPVALLILVACSSESAPRPPPVVTTLCSDSRQSTELGDVVEELGYALAPKYLPEGFGLSGTSTSGGRARLVFGDPKGRLIIAYPVEFLPAGSPTMREFGLVQPEDAVSEFELSGQTAYLMRGGWSDATVVAGPTITPDQAEWDYEKSLTLFFDCPITEGSRVGVAIQALANPSEWISDTEMVKIALSLVRILLPQETKSG